MNQLIEIVLGCIVVVAWAVLPAAYLTGLFTSLSGGSWGLLIIETLIFPIAIIHGIMVWFGAA